MKKCCFGCNLVPGVGGIAIFGIIREIFFLGCVLSLWIFGHWTLEEFLYVEWNGLWSWCGVDESEDEMKPWFQTPYLTYCIIVAIVCFTIIHIILLTGLARKNSVLMLIWLIFDGIATLVCFL